MWILMMLAATGLGACAKAPPPRFHMRTASLDTLDHAYTVALPAASEARDPLPAATAVVPRGRGGRIDPLLEEWLRDSLGSTRKRVIVSFRDTVRMPPFPDPVMTEPRNSPTNLAKRDTAAMRIVDIRAARGPQYAADTLLAAARGASILATFWLVQAVVVEMTLDSVVALSNHGTVRYIEPEDAPADPPDLSTSIPLEVAEGRRQINSDPYRDLGLAYGWVGLLDTGVDDHALLAAGTEIDPAHVAGRYDFVFGTTHADAAQHAGDGDDVTDVAPDDGHGTASMAILTGNARLEDSHEGVTAASVSSYRVYWYEGATPRVCRYGAVRAMEEAREALEPTLVVEIDATASDESVLITAADAAYDNGASVVVAAGNVKGAETAIAAPARAHRAIGVGAYLINEKLRTPLDLQRRGPADDGRIKPDVIAPTGASTASTDGCAGVDCVETTYYAGTSGATPFAAGAAILWRNWITSTGSVVEPGQVYAFMILSGRETSMTDAAGAGPIRMPSDGWAWFGSTQVDAGKTQPIEIEVPWNGVVAIEAALWWPESGESHSVHKLEILDPAGTSVAKSDHATSVFQRATHGDPRTLDGWPEAGTDAEPAELEKGTWAIHITRAATPTPVQTVFFAIVARATEPPGSTLMAVALDESEESGESGEDDGTESGGSGDADTEDGEAGTGADGDPSDCFLGFAWLCAWWWLIALLLAAMIIYLLRRMLQRLLEALGSV
jgi:hypothetical protein